MVIYSRLLLFF
jgi:hypothetical protein